MTSLAASLTEQIERLRQDKATTALCTYMVQLLDENGYLHPEDLADIRQLGIEQTLIDRALAILQSLEPAGVGARSAGECLLLQLQRRYPRERTAEQIVTQCLPLLAKKLHFDPAVMASPFISTIVDSLSLLIYFRFASLFLGL